MEEFEPIEVKKKKKKSKTNTLLIVLMIVMCFVMLSSLIVTAFTLKLYNDSINKEEEIIEEEPEITYTQDEVDQMIADARAEEDILAVSRFKAELKETAESNSGIITTLRKFYPEYFVYYTGSHYNFLEIDNSQPLINVNNDNLIANEGFIEYHDNGQVTSVKGIDVSKYQGDIDWDKVAASGVKYVMIRLGLRGYETGKLVLDENFEDNIEGALDAGLEVGVYFFTQAITESEAREEAEFVCKALEPYDITYPIALDVEDLYNDKARSYNQTAESRTACAKAFADYVKNNGYTAVIYGNLTTFSRLLNLNDLAGYDKWLAYYESNIYFPYEIAMWQYSDKGHVDGIDGDVDLNISFPVPILSDN